MPRYRISITLGALVVFMVACGGSDTTRPQQPSFSPEGRWVNGVDTLDISLSGTMFGGWIVGGFEQRTSNGTGSEVVGSYELPDILEFDRITNCSAPDRCRWIGKVTATQLVGHLSGLDGSGSVAHSYVRVPGS